jgi:hypothetical protein
VLSVLALAGVSRAFAFPAEQTLLPSIVPADAYLRATARASVAVETVRIGGPAFGGVLVAAGVLPAYGTAIALAAAGALLVPFVPLLARPPAEKPASLRDALAGARFILARPVLGGSIALDLFAVLFGGATALLPVFATQVLHVGAIGFGALRASSGIGAVVSAFVLARRPIHRRAGPRLLAAVAAFGAATVVFGVAKSLWIAMLALACAGAADMVSVVIREGIVMLGTPNEMRGRVSAVEGIFIGASNELGEFESGMLASLIGAVPAVVAGGVATIAITALWTWRNRALRTLNCVASIDATPMNSERYGP